MLKNYLPFKNFKGQFTCMREMQGNINLTQRSHAPLLLQPNQLDLSPNSPTVLVDSTWFMPNIPRNGRAEFNSLRLPKARFLDLDEVASSHELGLKHMMPSPHVFAKACEKLGIERSSHVILYDSQGIFSSPRALFMFRAFGHDKSSVLDGGLHHWKSQGLPVETGPPTVVEEVEYALPILSDSVVRDYDIMVDIARSKQENSTMREIVIDARSSGRFTGAEPEPRPGLPSGHIPSSFSLPYNLFLEPHSIPNTDIIYTTFRPTSEIGAELCNSIGSANWEKVLDGKYNIITSCGSGMTAGVLWLGLKLIGIENVSLYDESWAGYAARNTSLIEKGPAKILY